MSLLKSITIAVIVAASRSDETTERISWLVVGGLHAVYQSGHLRAIGGRAVPIFVKQIMIP